MTQTAQNEYTEPRNLSRRQVLALAVIAMAARKKVLQNPEHQPVPRTLSPAATGLVYDDIYLEHHTPPGFPERPERLTAIIDRLKKTKLLEQLVKIRPRTDALEWISSIHSKQYICRVEQACRDGDEYIDSMDCPISAKSYAAAVAAAGGVLAAVDAVMESRVQNAFCAVRPPGHHACRDGAMGFCLFNNVAIAAKYIQKQYKLKKILIVDWDVHHGNGTQQAFYDDGGVCYFSIHRWPFYPGSGTGDEKGTGPGQGLIVNVPLPAGSGDEDYIKAFEEVLRPVAAKFAPDFVLISAGFDAREDDPLGGMAVTDAGFAELTRIVKEIAETCCRGRIVSSLEGGYDLDGLASAVQAHIGVLQSQISKDKRA